MFRLVTQGLECTNLMFLTIQINDIVDVVKSAIILLFADDIKISYEIMNFNSQKFAIFTTKRSR